MYDIFNHFTFLDIISRIKNKKCFIISPEVKKMFRTFDCKVLLFKFGENFKFLVTLLLKLCKSIVKPISQKSRLRYILLFFRGFFLKTGKTLDNRKK